MVWLFFISWFSHYHFLFCFVLLLFLLCSRIWFYFDRVDNKCKNWRFFAFLCYRPGYVTQSPSTNEMKQWPIWWYHFGWKFSLVLVFPKQKLHKICSTMDGWMALGYLQILFTQDFFLKIKNSVFFLNTFGAGFFFKKKQLSSSHNYYSKIIQTFFLCFVNLKFFE